MTISSHKIFILQWVTNRNVAHLEVVLIQKSTKDRLPDSSRYCSDTGLAIFHIYHSETCCIVRSLCYSFLFPLLLISYPTLRMLDLISKRTVYFLSNQVKIFHITTEPRKYYQSYNKILDFEAEQAVCFSISPISLK